MHHFQVALRSVSGFWGSEVRWTVCDSSGKALKQGLSYDMQDTKRCLDQWKEEAVQGPVTFSMPDADKVEREVKDSRKRDSFMMYQLSSQ